MPKPYFNQTNANLDTLSNQLRTIGWAPNNILTSPDQNTVITNSFNFSGNYLKINSLNVTNLTIPDTGIPCLSYEFINLTGASGCDVTVNLSAAFPLMDVGYVIQIWNNSISLSTITSTASAFPGNIVYPIQPGEIIKILVMSIEPTNGYFIILNDKESLTSLKIGSFQDVLINNTNINGYFERGWLLYGSYTIGSEDSVAFYNDNRLYTLFFTIYNNCPNAIVSGGRGVSAELDWAANKTIQMQYVPGGVLGQYDPSLSGTPDFSATGNTFGAFFVALTGANNGPHTHSYRDANNNLGGARVIGGGAAYAYPSVLTSSSGTGTPHNNTQPTLAVGRMIRGF